MEMTPLQIASEYRTGKDKTKTIKVLAELNAVTQRRIAEILQEQGEELPGHWKEKLAKGLKREPKERIATPACAPVRNDREPVTAGELRNAIVETVTPEDGDPSTPLAKPGTSHAPRASGCFAQDDSAALSPDGDPASRAGGITWPQYSRLMQTVGQLEGVGFVLESEIPPFYFDVVEDLATLADEIKPEVRK